MWRMRNVFGPWNVSNRTWPAPNNITEHIFLTPITHIARTVSTSWKTQICATHKCKYTRQKILKNYTNRKRDCCGLEITATNSEIILQIEIIKKKTKRARQKSQIKQIHCADMQNLETVFPRDVQSHVQSRDRPISRTFGLGFSRFPTHTFYEASWHRQRLVRPQMTSV